VVRVKGFQTLFRVGQQESRSFSCLLPGNSACISLSCDQGFLPQPNLHEYSLEPKAVALQTCMDIIRFSAETHNNDKPTTVQWLHGGYVFERLLNRGVSALLVALDFFDRLGHNPGSYNRQVYVPRECHNTHNDQAIAVRYILEVDELRWQPQQPAVCLPKK